jgi:hypothetical protein
LPAAATPEQSILDLLRSIKKDSETTRAQLAALQNTVAELSSVVFSLQEQVDTMPNYDGDFDYHMEDAEQAVSHHSAPAARSPQQQDMQHEST